MSLTCADLDSIAQRISNAFYAQYGNVTTAAQMQQDPAGLSRAAGEMIGATVRLVFHDAAEYDPAAFAEDGLRVDGCVNLEDPANNGLQEAVAMLDAIWLPVCNKISRADFWVLAAQTMMQETCPYTATRRGGSSFNVEDPQRGGRRLRQADESDESDATPHSSDSSNSNFFTFHGRGLLKGSALHRYVVFPFRYGRVDRADCSYTGASRLPSAEKNFGQIVRALMTNMGLSVAQTVALIGAHTLGLANVRRSGYDSYWKDRPDLWDITYYKVLLVNTFTRNNTLRDPRTGAQLQQWSISKRGGRNPNAFMTNTDMQLVYDIDASNASGNTMSQCRSYAVTLDPGNIVLNTNWGGAPDQPCPFLRNNPAAPDFTTYALLFGEGNTATQDEPGASRWMANFTSAWKIMTELGYADSDLHCTGCTPAYCARAGCTASDLCIGQMDWSLNDNVTFGNWSSWAGYSYSHGSGSGSYAASSTPTPTPAQLPSASSKPRTNTIKAALLFTGVPPSTFGSAGAVPLLQASITAALAPALATTPANTSELSVSITAITDVATGATIFSVGTASRRRLQLPDSVLVAYSVVLPGGTQDAVVSAVTAATSVQGSSSAAFISAVAASITSAAAVSTDAQLAAGFTAFTAAAAAPATSPAAASSTPAGISAGAAAGIAVGAIALLLLVGRVLYCRRRGLASVSAVHATDVSAVAKGPATVKGPATGPATVSPSFQVTNPLPSKAPGSQRW